MDLDYTDFAENLNNLSMVSVMGMTVLVNTLFSLLDLKEQCMLH
jgi:hypothetical protein